MEVGRAWLHGVSAGHPETEGSSFQGAESTSSGVQGAPRTVPRARGQDSSRRGHACHTLGSAPQHQGPQDAESWASPTLQEAAWLGTRSA